MSKGIDDKGMRVESENVLDEEFRSVFPPSKSKI
jgi:hypothetical protein